ncbi:trypsin-like peptidase domain-containing protein [Streptomonospora sediminis]
MTDDTGPRIPESGPDQTWSPPHFQAEGQPGSAQNPADPSRPAEQAPSAERRDGYAPEGAPQPPPNPYPDMGRSAQTGSWAAPPPQAPVAGTGQWHYGAGGPAPNTTGVHGRQPPQPPPHGGGAGAGMHSAGGPQAPAGPPSYGAPGFPPGPPGAPPGPSAPGPPEPAERRRGMPLWAVLAIVCVVALGSAGIGGAVGGTLTQQTAAPEATPSPKLNTELPSGAPSRAPGTVAGVAQRVSPSVVSIQHSDPQLGGNGSGFVIENDHVVTNNHVATALEDGDIEVAYSNGATSGASIVGGESASDVAVLKLEDPIQVQPLEFGDSDKVTVGDQVIAIGAPLGLAGTVTTGIVSAVDRSVHVGDSAESEELLDALQTDAAINPGNSGGPLVDAQGRVIGVNTAIATMGGGAESGGQSGSIGLGFAIPSSEVEEVVDEIIGDNGNGGSGGGGAAIGADLDPQYDQGARIGAADGAAVDPGGPADQAGLRPGDVIIGLDGEDVAGAQDLEDKLGELAPGDRVEIVFERDNERRTSQITLGEP